MKRSMGACASPANDSSLRLERLIAFHVGRGPVPAARREAARRQDHELFAIDRVRRGLPGRVRKPVLYTVGHSTRPIGDFLKLLEAHGIQNVVDVRAIPRSRRNPQYEQTALRQTLKAVHIRYQQLRQLGGRRHARKDSPNGGWINASFRGFADHMQSKDFQEGLRRLEAEARKRVTAIMCAEGFAARCHRSLIADALVVDGWRVLHIQSRKTANAHHRTPFLKVRRGRLLYPKPVRPGAQRPDLRRRLRRRALSLASVGRR